MIGYIVAGYILDLQGFRGQLVHMRKVEGKWHVTVQVIEEKESNGETGLVYHVHVYDDVQVIECDQ